jgi:hypothetical protein
LPRELVKVARAQAMGAVLVGAAVEAARSLEHVFEHTAFILTGALSCPQPQSPLLYDLADRPL